MTKLTSAQERALSKIRQFVFPVTASMIGCSLSTLEALRRRGLVEVAYQRAPADAAWPRFDVFYRAVVVETSP